MNNITNFQLPRLAAFATDQAVAHGADQDLTALVVVPVSAGSRREADVIAHTVFGGPYRVHEYLACEGLRRLLGSGSGLVGGFDELHLGCDFFAMRRVIRDRN